VSYGRTVADPGDSPEPYVPEYVEGVLSEIRTSLGQTASCGAPPCGAGGVLHAFPRRANILPRGNPKASGGDGLLRLLLVEDHAAFRSALALLLGLRPA
jgi:hypothetical protein